MADGQTDVDLGRSCTTVVRVRDLKLQAHIGINSDEIGRVQDLIISIELTLIAGHVHAMDRTIDYREVAEAAATLARSHVPLIETFALRLAEHCLRHPAVTAASVSVDKPSAIANGIAGTSVHLRRPCG
ncbi:dihydroneopterin aldolase [Rhizorhabdus dicambivorans]|uniref:dihydroneopterin aldolase n=1 Tax=Rhizorhabdus dicambivorans TaxID=1850238 RepID=A0A2A4FQH7_9SPHN|nr:dihydroneopterin aldolase [Rhizorhabdus dicambivorans]ATE67390.1 dihydroneopterin aldolase [Rhizorhabdus dicambivorans]PCE39698.1 dihydroneopterin aldolase [Rhizorhabdus dicambivorans]